MVNLSIKWTSTSTGEGRCSGAIIDSYHILTAGHCVYDFGGTNDWAYSIKVFPGRDNGDLPYNYAWATYAHSYTGWTNNGMTEHDWAVVALDRSIGDYTGWMGRQTAGYTSSIYNGAKNVAGYPGTPSGVATCPTWANCQYYDGDNTHSTSEFNHWYSMDTSGGMSGGPVWRYTSDLNRYILTTHTCGTGGCGVSGKGVNHGTRLNNDKYDRIFTWIAGDDVARPPADKADLLDDGQSFSGFSPKTVAPGDNFSAWADVRNVGTAASGTFKVSFFASTNTTITTLDYFLGNATVSSINPFTWRNADALNFSFPASVPNGSYYVGWIIDRYSAVNEFDESNNTSYKTAYKLTVQRPPDGGDDIFWYAPGASSDYLWLARGGGNFASQPKTVNGTYTPLVGNFAGNAASDIFWYAPGPSADYLWTATTSGSFSSAYRPVSGTYEPILGDFDNNGFTDIFWYRAGSGADYLWRSNGNGTFTSQAKSVSGTYTPLVGNLAGNAASDIFWYAAGPSADYLWTATAGGNFSSVYRPVSGTYEPLLGDFDNSNFTDIFWYRAGSGADYLWRSNGNGTFTSQYKPVTGTYTPLVGNFAGNAASDIFWYAPGPSADYLWTATAGGNFSSVYRPVSGTYEPLLGDFDKNNFTDIFWYRAGSGADYLWRSNGNGTFTSMAKSVSGTYTPLVGNFDGTTGLMTSNIIKDRQPKDE